jgi:hypothetical protein
MDGLWKIATAIYTTWQLDGADENDPFSLDATHVKSTWTEHVRLRAEPTPRSGLPSYVAEYENALKIVADLEAAQPSVDLATALKPLLFAAPAPTKGSTPLCDTPLLHAKRYVVDEFITVLIVGGGFRQFGGWNYDGFLGGSRFGQVNAIARPIYQIKLGAAG